MENDIEEDDKKDTKNIDVYQNVYTREIFVRETNAPFQILRNILIGKTISNPFCEEVPNKRTERHIGNHILDVLKSDPFFIGQIDAETGKKTTFEEMREKSVKCALWLKTQHICRNNVITVCTKNQLDAYIPFLAGLYIGCKVNPLDEYLVKENLDYFLKKIKPKIIFVSASFAMATLQFACEGKGEYKSASLPKIVVFENHEVFENLHSILNYRTFNEEAVNNFSCPMISIRETAIILFSSGTDSLPKDVDIPQSVFMAPSNQQAPFMRCNDVAIWFESFGFITGMFLTIGAIVSYVTAIKVKPMFHAEKACNLIKKYYITWMFLKTNMCAELVKAVDVTKYDVSSLKKVLFGGSVINHDVHANLIKSLPNASIIQVYNLTETGIIAYQRKTGKIGSSGYVGRNIQLMITSLYPSAKEIPLGPNMRGQIWCCSPYMMKKYYSDTTSDINYYERWMTNWFKTGDIGYYDEDGNVFVTERINQIFKYKKKTISPVEIETMLQNHLAVLEAVVVPVPHALEDEYPKAFITKVPKKKVTEEELKQWVIEKLGPDKDLRGGVIFISQMPRISNGKIQRKIFNYWAQADTYFNKK